MAQIVYMQDDLQRHPFALYIDGPLRTLLNNGLTVTYSGSSEAEIINFITETLGSDTWASIPVAYNEHHFNAYGGAKLFHTYTLYGDRERFSVVKSDETTHTNIYYGGQSSTWGTTGSFGNDLALSPNSRWTPFSTQVRYISDSRIEFFITVLRGTDIDLSNNRLNIQNLNEPVVLSIDYTFTSEYHDVRISYSSLTYNLTVTGQTLYNCPLRTAPLYSITNKIHDKIYIADDTDSHTFVAYVNDELRDAMSSGYDLTSYCDSEASIISGISSIFGDTSWLSVPMAYNNEQEAAGWTNHVFTTYTIYNGMYMTVKTVDDTEIPIYRGKQNSTWAATASLSSAGGLDNPSNTPFSMQAQGRGTSIFEYRMTILRSSDVDYENSRLNVQSSSEPCRLFIRIDIGDMAFRIYSELAASYIYNNSLLRIAPFNHSEESNDIQDCAIGLNKWFWPYTGEAIVPTESVYDPINERTLVNGTDYNVTITNNIDPGIATLTVTGIGTYHGSKSVEFTIQATEDPYEEGGTTDTGGGTGNFDDSSDEVDFPSLPDSFATAANFCSLYVPTLSELQDLSDYLWSEFFVIDSFKKMFANPMDVIIGLGVVPVAVSYENGTVTVGNRSTGVSMRRATSQFVMFDCGPLDIEEYWGSYLDYNPYTKINIFLPYIGFRELNPDDCMGKSVRLHYYIDILSGACVAILKVTGGNLDSCMYQFTGHCSTQIPINGQNFNNLYLTTINVATTAIANKHSKFNLMPGQIGNMASSMVAATKPDISRSDAVSSAAGLISNQTPYIVINRPKQALPDNQNLFSGYPIYTNSSLGDLNGYTEVESIHLEGVPATDAELDEIVTLLKQGVIF